MFHNTLILNPVSGISGDKMLSCLAALGADESFMNNVLEHTGIGSEVKAHITTEKRKGIKGSRVTFEFTSPKHRMSDDMRHLIISSRLAGNVKKKSLNIIDYLIGAEADVHGSDKRHIHFHELAHPDTIADAVITASAIEYLGIKKIFTTPINVGYGSVSTEHGIYPVPPPAVSLLLEGYLWHFGIEGDGELTTPTGAAILKALAVPIKDKTRFVHHKTGYGLGMTELPSRANVLQAFLC